MFIENDAGGGVKSRSGDLKSHVAPTELNLFPRRQDYKHVGPTGLFFCGIQTQHHNKNLLTNMVDAAGNTRFSYNSVGQLLSEDGPWASDTVSYTYNNRLRSGLTVQNPNGPAWSQGYAWDSVKHLTNITSPAGAFGYLYQAPRSMLHASLSLPNGAYITNVYDDMARITGTYLKGSNGTINAHEYGYNLGSQRTNTVRYDGSWVTYGYDSIGQLKTAQGVESNGTSRIHEKFGYAYDEAGNLNYRTNNALLQTFDVNNLNQLVTIKRTNTLTVAGGTIGVPTNVTVNGSTAALYQDYTFAKDGFSLVDGSNTFTAIAKDNLGRSATNVINAYLPETASYQYDLNGNLIFDGVKGFEYDDENQLIRLTVTNQWKSEFAYDGKMRRRIAREYIWQSGIWNLKTEIHYVYDGNLVIQERDANNLPQVTYTRGRDLSGSFEGAGGIGGLLARTPASSLQSPASLSAYYHADGNGNITCLTDSKQTLVARYLYDPFGNTLATSGILAEANTYRFSSKEIHMQSGLVYYLYRYYEPSLQRWLNMDPLSNQGFMVTRKHRPIDRITQTLFAVLGDDPHVGGYNYLNNHPLGRLEYLGLSPMDCSLPCTSAPPLLDTSPACDAYGTGRYLGSSLTCFCQCAGNSSWSQNVRGCLACAFRKGMDISAAHDMCYAANGGILSGPVLTLGFCAVTCEDPPWEGNN